MFVEKKRVLFENSYWVLYFGMDDEKRLILVKDKYNHQLYAYPARIDLSLGRKLHISYQEVREMPFDERWSFDYLDNVTQRYRVRSRALSSFPKYIREELSRFDGIKRLL